MTNISNQDAATIEQCLLPTNADIPNNNSLPLVLYRQVVDLPQQDPASIFERLFSEHQWPDAWRNGIFSFHHYHSTAHEVLGIYAGTATVQFGGSGGKTFTVTAGDVVVIPAGVAHKNLGENNLGVVGAYPEGQHPDMCRSNEGKVSVEQLTAKQNAVLAVGLPAMDPIYGAKGPLMGFWVT